MMKTPDREREKPLPIDRIPDDLCRRLRWLFTDIDDTLTTGGMLPDYAFRAVWRLSEAGIRVVPVTGRPAGWCDHIARMWPVAGVVGENGAFSFSYDREKRTMNRRYTLSEEERSEGQRRLRRIEERVLREVSGCGISADQAFRITDLAVDYCEDVDPLDRDGVRAICRIAREEGATFKVSSIHVNCWFGDFDKVTCVREFLGNRERKEWEDLREDILFIGDSPNDAPMFREFPYSVGVANLEAFLEEIEWMPGFITSRPSSLGFREAVCIILERRAGTATAAVPGE